MPSDNVVNLHREVSLTLLRNSFGYAVRTPRGQKDPGHFKWDPRTNNEEESRKTIYTLERSDDNLGIHLFGRVIDVDIDTDNPYLISALDYFLPHTSHVWGRKSRPRTHRLYELLGDGSQTKEIKGSPYDPAMFPFLRTIKKYKQIEMEVRGGEIRNGQYSLLPGSLHPSGEMYEWEDVKAARSSPVAVDLYRIINGVRFACAVATLAPYWTEGSRNSLCMALSGFLHRAVSHVSDLGGDSALYFEKRDAEELLRALMNISGDAEEDISSRMKTFEKTWEKADAGVPVQGATTLTKITGDNDLLTILYSLLADTPDLIAFDEFLDRYAIRSNTSNIVDRQRVGMKTATWLMTVNDLRNSTMHMTITTGDGSKRQMAGILLSSNRALRVDGFAFMPGADEILERPDGKYINQWRGFEVPPFQGPVTEADVQPFLDYVLKILSNGNPDVRHWVLSWAADIFKYPASKCGTALVLVGKPGAGKSFLGEYIIRKIIGRSHSMQTNTVESLTNNFNADSVNCLYIHCDEATNSRKRTDANKLKSMITDTSRRVEPKNVNAYETEDWARYCFTSNEIEDAVAIVDGEDDRRYTVLRVNETYARKSLTPTAVKRKYWDDIHAWAEDKDNLAKIHRFLLDYEYDRAEIREPLDTEARRTIVQHSQRGIEDWLMAIVAHGHPLDTLDARDRVLSGCCINTPNGLEANDTEWPDWLNYSALEEAYSIYRRSRSGSGSIPVYNAQQIADAFRERGLIPVEEKRMKKTVSYAYRDGDITKYLEKRINIRQFPKYSDLLEYLEEKLGYIPDNNVVHEEFKETKKKEVEY